MVTVMYDKHGTQKWVQRYTGPVNGHNKGTSLALDGESNVYVTGWSQKTVTPVNLDLVTVKYDVGGNELWVARYDGPAGANDQPAPPAGFQLGTSGSTYSYVQNNQGIIVTSEPVDPVPAVDDLIGMVSGLDVDRGIQVSLLAKLNACRDSLVAANAGVRKNANNILGAFINQVQSAAVENRIAAEDANEMISIANEVIKGKTVVYVGGQSTGAGTGADFAVIKYKGADGTPMWNLLGQPGTAAGKPGNPPDIALRYNGLANSTDRIWAIAMDQDGNLYVAGPSMEASARSVDFFTIKYFVRTDSPVVLGTARYDGPGNGVDQACGSRHGQTRRRQAIHLQGSGHRRGLRCRDGKQHRPRDPGLQEYATLVYDGALSLRWNPEVLLVEDDLSGQTLACRGFAGAAIAAAPPSRDRSQRSISRLRNSTMPQVVLDRENASACRRQTTRSPGCGGISTAWARRARWPAAPAPSRSSTCAVETTEAAYSFRFQNSSIAR